MPASIVSVINLHSKQAQPAKIASIIRQHIQQKNQPGIMANQSE
jgi:hypothetical protein